MKIKAKVWLAAVLVSLSVVGAGSPALARATDGGTHARENAPAENDYLLDVGGQQVALSDGESATFPMLEGPIPEAGTVAPRVTYSSNCGTLTVTASAGTYSWGINMTCPATGFIGQFHITDLSSGLGGGFTPVFAFSGTAPTSKLHNHRYSGTLTGTADLAGVIVAHVVPNATLYTYP
ncbi:MULTISPECIES: hypothetical protein [unclassified Microbacterium]|uniref:hypothetical protein n=1 Tax=unclassified Microbacterium TaxID=2609290 RepID=UPI001605241B|nr:MULTISPECIES: hypothetical protein [unclassified Microbacterium]QNA91639.1 hypothetical protein G4G29_02775 [Microbacterium sp. Se63.02b]QYM64821.1 hypothetical protein K1X59_02760 [Microbacterium sp. Se5.02b]